ncbi:MAG: MFS transporter [Pseudomonadales bacterium]|nr:MFS transporter [Pseudomonadales bacterium]
MISFTGRLSALRHTDYRRYWLGSCCSVGAAQLQIMAQGWLVYDLTGSAMMLGYLGAAASLPSIIMTLFGGVMADAMDKKKLITIACLGSTLLLALLAWLDFSDQVSVWHVIAISGSLALISGFDWPSRQAIFPALIEPDDMMSAVALNAIIWQATRMLMPALGGLLIALVDTWLVFALCALGWLGMLGVILNIHRRFPPAAGRGSALGQMAEGVRYILHSNLFRVLIGLGFIGMGLGSTYQQMMPALAGLLQANETGYGLLISAGGVGSVFGTIMMGNAQRSARLGHWLLGSAMASVLCVYLLTLVTAALSGTPFAMTLAMLSVFGAALFTSVFMVMSMTILQLAVPDELRGRVMGIQSMCYNLMPLGGLLAGWLAGPLTVAGALALMASVYLAVLIFTASTQADIRSLSGTGV